jgi:hypothetical protein
MIRQLIFGFTVLVTVTPSVTAGTVTTFSDRTTFNSAVSPSPLTVENFTTSDHFPITTGLLNSATNLVVSVGTPILPGDIQPGVTYSTAIGSGNFFNIDAGGGFDGGFLDSLRSPGVDNILNVAFDNPTLAFGFDTNSLMGSNFDLVIHFTSGPDFVASNPVGGGAQFFGFASTSADIVSATVAGNDPTFAFAVDNFTFTSPQEVVIPEPSSLVIVSILLCMFGAGWTRKRLRHVTAAD